MEFVFTTKPPPPETVEDTGLDLDFIADLVLKHSLFMGEFKMAELTERVKLPYSVIDKAVEALRRNKYLEVKGGSGYASATYTFKTSEAGKSYGAELLHLCHYVGPAPVTLDDYQATVRRQTVKSILIPEVRCQKGLFPSDRQGQHPGTDRPCHKFRKGNFHIRASRQRQNRHCGNRGETSPRYGIHPLCPDSGWTDHQHFRPRKPYRRGKRKTPRPPLTSAGHWSKGRS